MPKFQSRLFNWIDQSLPAKLGRRARRFFDQKFEKLSFEELPRLLAYQSAKAALYPVYLIASTLKRTFPALDGGQGEVKLRSQPDLSGLLPASYPKIPLILRPLAKFLDWLDRLEIRLDQNIAAIIRRQPDKLATSEHFELEPKLIANLIFADIWQKQVEQYNANQNKIDQK